ncbi:hypothetical protein [Streptomyces sp. KCTC 0041BP]|uniref:hypothetical protein n=1 Tax=Streptomyces sp. KCTC 0041BP TaxID=201500 RepID=UPI001AE2D5FA|nr:hypothetical protein [Streptomyces sp. KCTC 0041BP]MBP0932621.1 hypothetical protein [Streptomyces sp. KCTC 0041BP]
MTFLQESSNPGRTDWELARLAVHLRGYAKYADDPETDAVRRLGEVFTEDEVRRADAFLEAGHQDADRLAAIAARLGKDAASDEAWLVQQLATAWMRLDELRDRIDDGGSLMANTHVASAIDYVRGSRP